MSEPQSELQDAPRRSRIGLWLAILPLAVFLGLAGLFYLRLGFDASQIPSVLIGKSIPNFSLPALAGAGVPGFGDSELRKGKVTLVNVFASWCGPCRDEHPLLMELSKDKALADKGVRIFGLNYKDRAANALSFLQGLGNPYERVGADTSGRTGIDWGVYGVPETFVVKGDGTIAYKYIGPLSPEGVKSRLLPAIEKAMQ